MSRSPRSEHLGNTPPTELYEILRAHFGFLDWWPGDTKEEILVGAVLTQQTSWKNVERAIDNLRRADALSVAKISEIRLHKLEALIRPSGYYRQKARRLKAICKAIIDGYGSIDGLFSLDAPRLREVLLAMDGIGCETADSIILYAAEKLAFVIDAYTKREMGRIYGEMYGKMGYTELQQYFTASIPKDIELYKDMHAQFVELGKNFCKSTRPLCHGCPLHTVCRYGRAQTDMGQQT